MVDLKSFDWRSLKKYLEPKAAGDLNVFLERLPQTAGQTALIAAGIAWTAAAGIGLYTTIQIKNMTTLREELKETKALKPAVPVLQDVPVSQTEIKEFGAHLAAVYPNLSIKQQGSSIQITAKSTGLFGQFREAVGHVQNGGEGWRVSVEKLCVGRECPQNALGALLKVNKVSVDLPKS